VEDFHDNVLALSTFECQQVFSEFEARPDLLDADGIGWTRADAT